MVAVGDDLGGHPLGVEHGSHQPRLPVVQAPHGVRVRIHARARSDAEEAGLRVDRVELPVLMDLATGWNGKIWVVRRGEEPTEAGAVDVLTPAGQYVGTFAAGDLRLPWAFGPDGLVAFVETDDFDVPTVVVRRLPAILR